jgi:hypothetical protein
VSPRKAPAKTVPPQVDWVRSRGGWVRLLPETEMSERLRNRFPALIPPRRSGSPLSERGIEVGDGWEMLVENLLIGLRDLGYAKPIIQIKEKFGGLRVYHSLKGWTESMDKRLRLAEAMAWTTCETCGDPGQLYATTDSGWRYVACLKHKRPKSKVVKVERVRNVIPPECPMMKGKKCAMQAAGDECPCRKAAEL